MTPMSRDEWMRFLTEGTRTAKLATVRADGRPHVAPVWFVVDGDSLVFMTLDTSVKGRNLQSEARVMLSVDEETPPYSFVLIEGIAGVSRLSPQELLPWSRRIADRYMAAEEAPAAADRNAVEGELLVRVPFTKVIAAKGVAS
jgi:PPOX class probable F420-dependent enzyme